MTRSIFALLILFFTASSTLAASPNALHRFRDSSGMTYTCMTPIMYTRTVAKLTEGQACSYKTEELIGIIDQYAKIDTLNRSSIESCLDSRDTVQASLRTVTRAYEEYKFRSSVQKWVMFAAGATTAIVIAIISHSVH